MPYDLLQDTSQCIGTDPSGHKLTTKNFVRKRFNFDVWVVVCVSERDSPKPCECCTVCHNIDKNMWRNLGNVYTRYGSEQNVYCDVWKNDTNRRKNLRDLSENCRKSQKISEKNRRKSQKSLRKLQKICRKASQTSARAQTQKNQWVRRSRAANSISAKKKNTERDWHSDSFLESYRLQ